MFICVSCVMTAPPSLSLRLLNSTLYVGCLAHSVITTITATAAAAAMAIGIFGLARRRLSNAVKPLRGFSAPAIAELIQDPYLAVGWWCSCCLVTKQTPKCAIVEA